MRENMMVMVGDDGLEGSPDEGLELAPLVTTPPHHSHLSTSALLPFLTLKSKHAEFKRFLLR